MPPSPRPPKPNPPKKPKGNTSKTSKTKSGDMITVNSTDGIPKSYTKWNELTGRVKDRGKFPLG